MSDSKAATRVTATREIQLDIGHRIPFHKALCANVHGHRYRVVATVEGPAPSRAGASDDGMVLDFGDLKGIMMREIHAPLDHAFAVWRDDQPLRGFLEGQGFRLVVMDDVPTAENLARWCFRRLDRACREKLDPSVRLRGVTVWETPNCSASCDRVGD